MRDIDIRESLKTGPLKKYVSDSDSLVLDEFNISLGIVRADIAILNGVLHGIEIKSEKDTLKRLDTQLTEYKKFFEYITVVTCEKFQNKIENSIPERCGILVAKSENDKIVFKTVRKAKKNYDIDKICLAKSLWKEEIIDALKEINYKKGLKSKSKPLLYEILCDNFSKQELLKIVKEKIKTRINWRAVE
ncbi:hypothetical protein CMU20_01660 [Elizabethkingia anophelis]|nr:hypothetical protein [Elizabethkingia anophelis]